MPPVFEWIITQLGEHEPRAATATVRFSEMADAQQAVDVLFRVTSSLDQDVTIQVVGHIVNEGTDENGLVNIGTAVSLPAGSTTGQVITIKVKLSEQLHPYLGLAIVTATQPAAGLIQATAYVRNPLLHVS